MNKPLYLQSRIVRRGMNSWCIFFNRKVEWSPSEMAITMHMYQDSENLYWYIVNWRCPDGSVRFSKSDRFAVALRFALAFFLKNGITQENGDMLYPATLVMPGTETPLLLPEYWGPGGPPPLPPAISHIREKESRVVPRHHVEPYTEPYTEDSNEQTTRKPAY